MGHCTEHFVFDVNKNKKVIEAEMNQRAIFEGDYHKSLNQDIRWIDHICEDEDEARTYVESHDKGWYDQLAVKFRDYPKLEPTKTLLNLKERVKREKEKKENYMKMHSISTFKIEFIGCSGCGSKLKRKLLHGERCPLCSTDLRGKTTIDTIQRYNDNIEKLKKQIKEEEKKIQRKNIKKAKIKWLVKIEYHI